ncbi:MAG: preprotein translocase subunit YajC [Actinobacteria bacterium]|nr:preprotein translocase subunit YajC [Thermoleophilia bacterium]MCB9010950.1 preprotein translocase subunit YajC [Actinomycetota bacterium]
MGGSLLLIYLLVFGAIIYMMVVLPQRRLRAQQQATMTALSAGDEIVTTAGVYGTVTEIEDAETLLLEVAEDVEIRIAKASVARILKDETAGSDTVRDDGSSDGA